MSDFLIDVASRVLVVFVAIGVYIGYRAIGIPIADIIGASLIFIAIRE